MGSLIGSPTIENYSYLSLIRTYEINPPEFHKTLLAIQGTVSSDEFWQKLYERRSESSDILFEHAFKILTEQNNLKILNPVFAEAQKNWSYQEKKIAASNFYKQLDPVCYLNLLEALISGEEPAEFSHFLIAHLLKLQERKEFSLLFRDLLRTLSKAPQGIAETYISAASQKIPQAKFKALIEAEWNSLPLTGQCRLIPYLPLEFLFSKISKATLKEIVGWIHTLMTALTYIKPRAYYFKEFLKVANDRFLVSEIIQAITPLSGSPALTHFLSDLNMYQFNSFVTLGAEPMTNFLYSVEFESSDETRYTINAIKDDLKKYNFFLNESQIYIYEDDSVAGVDSPRSFTEFIDSAMIHQTIEGDLLDAYIERIRNLPPVLFLIYAADITLFSWVVKCSVYLEEKALRYLAYGLRPEESLILFSFLFRKNKFTQAISYLIAAPEDAKVLLLNKILKWFNEKNKAAKRSQDQFEDLIYATANYKLLYDAMQTTISLRREIDGPLARHLLILSKNTFIDPSIPAALKTIEAIVNETRLAAKEWLQPDGAIALVYKLEPSLPEDPNPSFNLPDYLLSQLNTRLLSFANLQSADKLVDLGLVNERDFEILGLDKHHQLEVDNIEMQINALHPEEAPYETAILWEEIKKGNFFNKERFDYQLNSLKNLLEFKTFDTLSSGEEVDIRFKLQKIIINAIQVYGIPPEVKSKLENLSLLGAPMNPSFEVLVRFVRDYSFENRLTTYLTQPLLEQLWRAWKLHECTSVYNLAKRHKMGTSDLYNLKKQFNPENNQ